MPSLEPPGPPDGDRISSTATEWDRAEMLTVVNDPVLGSRSLRFTNRGLSPHYVNFHSVPAPESADIIYVYWRGVRRGLLSVPLHFTLSQGHDPHVVLATLSFIDGEVHVRLGPEESQTIAQYRPDLSHFVLLTVDRRTLRSRVSFLQRGVRDPAYSYSVSEDIRVADRPALTVNYGAGPEGAEYVIDDVVITTRRPEM